MKSKIKIILISVLVGIIILPTIVMGGSFTTSLIQGKSIPEALQILATQIDSLIGRVDMIEDWQVKEEACRKASDILPNLKSCSPDEIGNFQWLRERYSLYSNPTYDMLYPEPENPEEPYPDSYWQEWWQMEAEKMMERINECEELKTEYFIQKELCKE